MFYIYIFIGLGVCFVVSTAIYRHFLPTGEDLIFSGFFGFVCGVAWPLFLVILLIGIAGKAISYIIDKL